MKKLFTLLSIFVLVGNAAFAGYGFEAGAINSNSVQDMRWHEAETRARKSAIVTPKTGTQLPKEVVDSNINSVVFVNNVSFSSSVLNNVIKNDLNKPMTSENVAAIRRDIMKFYQNQGFFSAIALIVAQDTKTGELTIEVREGGKNSIQIQE